MLYLTLMDFQSVAELNEWLYGLTDQTPFPSMKR